MRAANQFRALMFGALAMTTILGVSVVPAHAQSNALSESCLPKAPRPPKMTRSSTLRNQRIIRLVSV